MPKKTNTPQQKPQLVFDPKRKMYFDQTAGMYIEPNTNLYIDPDTGFLLEPQTNKLIPNSEAPSKIEIRPKLSELPEDINKKFINYISEESMVDLINKSIKGAVGIAAGAGVRTVGPEIGSNIPKKTPSAEPQSSNPNRSSSRFEGTNSIVKTYKKDTPGEQKESINSKFTDFLSEDFIASGQQPYQDLSDVFNQRQLNSLIRNEDFRAFVTHHNPDLSKVMVKELGENRYLVGDASTGAPHTMEFAIDNEGRFDYHVVRKKVTGGDEQIVKSYNYNESKTPKARETSPSQVTLNIPKSATLNINMINEDLRKWFDEKDPEGGWKRINSKGEAIGPCAREEGEPKPKCMSNEKRAKLSKKERASAVRAKRHHDPDPKRKGKPINVSNFGKGKLSEMTDLTEENKPTNPKLWARAKALARQKFDVYPSAYANGWAAKWYKKNGGGWKTVNEEFEEFKEACWNGYKQEGTKPKGKRMVPNCVPEEYELEEETLGKIQRTSGGRKKFMVKVKNPKTGKIVTVRFGDPNMSIKRDDPERRKSFRARHHCDTNPGPRTKARYWSCRQWRAGAKVES